MTIKPSGVTSLSTTQSYNSISGVNSDLLSLDIYYRSNVSVSKPVVIYIHGGAWALGGKGNIDSKATFFNDLGYVFISVNYRLSPAANLIKGYNLFVGDDGTTATASTRVKHSTHVSDCATAVTWVYNNISSYGGNRNQLILIGHSAGAHLASLLATNQSYLTTAGLPSGKVIGCISLDTEGYDVYKEITQPVSGGQFDSANVQRSYQNAFGIYPDKTVTGTVNNVTTDFATTTAAQTSYTTASPISNINGSTPPFLVFRRGPSDRITRETEFVTALQTAGRTVAAVSYPDDTTYTHAEINESIGAVNDPPVGKSLPSGVSNVTTQIQNWITNLASPPPNALGGDSSLSFTEIQNEFGLPPQKNLGAYRVTKTVSGLSNLALDNEPNSSGIITALMPQSGAIKFSDFYSKKLNVVVDCTPASGTATRVNAKSKYTTSTNVTVIGGFAAAPTNGFGTKVWIHTNGDIGSDQSAAGIQATYASLLTGSWDGTADLRIDIGPNGRVFGAGGNGGKGGAASGGVGANGVSGSAALGVNATNSVKINIRGLIAGGGGGGGGGGSSFSNNSIQRVFSRSYQNSYANGGGGGGGLGYPFGTGGAGGSGNGTAGRSGTNATVITSGTGGNGSAANTNIGNDQGGGGGGGGFNGLGGSGGGSVPNKAPDGGVGTASKGGDGGSGRHGGGANSLNTKGGGTGGNNGSAIIISNNGTGVSIITTGTRTGSITYSTNPV